MKRHVFLSALVGAILTACQSTDGEYLTGPVDTLQQMAIEEEVTQITDDVNSAEVNNILKGLFGAKPKARSVGYNVSLFQDKDGVDRIICINYENNAGWVLISAEKTHSPIIAYSEAGNFSDIDNLEYPLNEWIDGAMFSVAESENLPADSLQKIANKWRRYEHPVMPLVDDYPSTGNISPEEYEALNRQIMDKMAEWSEAGYRYYPIENFEGTTSYGDKNGIINYLQGVVHPLYTDDIRSLTFVVEKDIDTSTGKGHWMKTQWTQDNGYNQSFDFVPGSTTKRMYVGCGPIAVGQVMYAYKYPTTFNWNAMTVTGPGNKVTSDFLLDVFYKCKGRYNPFTGGTSTDPDNIAIAMQDYGYIFDDINHISQIDINQMIDYPAILYSTLYVDNGSGGLKAAGGHGWIVEGGLRIQTRTTIEVWSFNYDKAFDAFISEPTDDVSYSKLFYVNWGGAYSNSTGYYDLSVMIPPGYKQNSVYRGMLRIRPNI